MKITNLEPVMTCQVFDTTTAKAPPEQTLKHGSKHNLASHQEA